MKLEPDSGSDESVPTLLHLQVPNNFTILNFFKVFVYLNCEYRDALTSVKGPLQYKSI